MADDTWVTVDTGELTRQGLTHQHDGALVEAHGRSVAGYVVPGAAFGSRRAAEAVQRYLASHGARLSSVGGDLAVTGDAETLASTSYQQTDDVAALTYQHGLPRQ